jgi:hypothetical protein
LPHTILASGKGGVRGLTRTKDDCCHGSAAIARNAARNRLLDNPDLFNALANTVLAEQQARAKVEALSASLDELCAYGEDTGEVRYFAQELAGREQP